MIPGSANPLLLASAAEDGAYAISRSLRFNSSDSAYLSRTPASAGNRKTWTWAGWVKRSSIGQPYADIFNAVDTGNVQDTIGFNNDKFFYYAPSIGTIRTSTAVYRDCAAWYHFVFCLDTTNATAQNRFRLWVNGSEVTTWQDNLTITQNVDLNVNKNSLHLIGAASGYTQPFDGYLADVHFIDGQALDPTSFTEVDATTGQLVPIAYSGTYGTNGFHLPFSDNSTAAALGTDTSGNGNTWTVNNISVTAGAGNDSLVDTPTNYGTDTGAGGEVRGNYCTWNPLAKGSSTTLSNGNLDMSSGGSWQSVVATLGATSGKWYWEQTMTTNQYSYTGICNQKFLGNVNSNWPGQTTNSWSYLTSSGLAKNDHGGGAEVSVTLTTMASGGGTLGFALDLDNQKLWFSLNGVWMGSGSPNPATGTAAAFTNLVSGDTYFPCADVYAASAVFNFGQRPFAYAAPSGFKALCTTNLPDPVVAKPSEVMDVLTWTGSGGNRTLSGLGFSPDLVWGKSRSAAYNHQLYDVVRGAGNNKDLSSSLTSAEGSATTAASQYGFLSAFTSDGFTVANGTDASLPNAYWNASGTTYVAWTWDAGSSTVTNTDGSITSQVRANPSAGFSVVTFNSGSSGYKTIGHGLNVAPQLIITKNRGTTSNWTTYHISGTKDKYLNLNSTSAFISKASIWGTAEPTSTVFGFKSGNNQLANYDCVAYCFAPVDGYSSMGSYVGNGSSDGPMVYTGMRPKWIMYKETTNNGSGHWNVYDSARSTYNVVDENLQANRDVAEFTFTAIDILSNGFKLRTNSSTHNHNGGTYIYIAFAESPQKFSRAR